MNNRYLIAGMGAVVVAWLFLKQSKGTSLQNAMRLAQSKPRSPNSGGTIASDTVAFTNAFSSIYKLFGSTSAASGSAAPSYQDMLDDPNLIPTEPTNGTSGVFGPQPGPEPVLDTYDFGDDTIVNADSSGVADVGMYDSSFTPIETGAVYGPQPDAVGPDMSGWYI